MEMGGEILKNLQSVAPLKSRLLHQPIEEFLRRRSNKEEQNWKKGIGCMT